MRRRIAVTVAFLFLTFGAAAKDIYLSVGGSVGNFRTDARIWNPSFDKEITITARYIAAGNVADAAVVTKTITVGKRTMAVYDDVVQSLFGGGAALGAVRLTSDDDFIASQRIYADLRSAAQAGTLGQFVPPVDATSGLKKGVLMGLKSGNSALGAFRTNWGGVNPNTSAANITFRLYDKQNVLAVTKTLVLQPGAVLAPVNIVSFFDNTARDLSDCWFTFNSDQPVIFYASVVDNGSTDPTFVPAAIDTGIGTDPVPEPENKSMTITARSFAFEYQQSDTLKAGDKVNLTASRLDGTHGLIILGPNGETIKNVNLGNTPVTVQITLPVAGVYTYACTNSGCGTGHGDMVGDFTVVNP
jgi:plastocyanin